MPGADGASLLPADATFYQLGPDDRGFAATLGRQSVIAIRQTICGLIRHWAGDFRNNYNT